MELLEKVTQLNELRGKMEELKGVIERWQKQERSTAIIVEPRKHRALGFVVKNVLENLNSNWTVRIYHGNGNENFVGHKGKGARAKPVPLFLYLLQLRKYTFLRLMETLCHSLAVWVESIDIGK